MFELADRFLPRVQPRNALSRSALLSRPTDFAILDIPAHRVVIQVEDRTRQVVRVKQYSILVLDHIRQALTISASEREPASCRRRTLSPRT